MVTCSRQGVFKGLQAAGVNPTASSRKLLQTTSAERDLLYSIRVEDVSAVKELLEEGVNPNFYYENGQPLLFVAMAIDNRAIIQLLIEYGVDIDNGFISSENNDKLPGLHAAALIGSTNALAAFLEAGAPIDQLDEGSGYTPLHYCMAGKHVAAAMLLLDKGAAVDVGARETLSTPLHFAAGVESNTQMISLLLSRGADVNSRNKGGQTPLISGILFNSTENVKVLILAGADVNAIDSNLVPAVGYASIFGMSGSLKLLVENGADVGNVGAVLCACAKEIIPEDFCNVSDCNDPERLQSMKKLLE